MLLGRCMLFALLLLLLPNGYAMVGLQMRGDSGVSAVEHGDLPELIVGVPREGYPPFIYEVTNQHYIGPLKVLASKIAAEMDVSLRYVSYESYVEARQALQQGEVDVLVGVDQDTLDTATMSQIGHLGAYPRAALMRSPNPDLTLAQAKQMRWVCIRGFGSCGELARLGITNRVEVNSRDEATYSVKLGVADAYLALRPAVELELQRLPPSMGIVTPQWVHSSSLTIATSEQRPKLTERLWQAYQRISVADVRLKIIEGDDSFDNKLLLESEEIAWLKKKKVIKFAVSPSFTGISEMDDRGDLHGYVADLMTIITARSGIKFELVPTKTWVESVNFIQQNKVDFIPFMAPLAERRERFLFTSSYMKFHSYVVTRRGGNNLKSLKDLTERAVGVIKKTYEIPLMKKYNARVVERESDAELFALLDAGSVDYILFTIPNLSQEAIRGFNEKYQIAYNSPELASPMSMAVNPLVPELKSIMDKLLLTVTDEEWDLLERRWLNTSVSIETDNSRFYRWLAMAMAIFSVLALLVFLWARSLSRQIEQRKKAERQLNEQLLFVQTLLNYLPTMVVLRDHQQRITLCNHAYRDTYLNSITGDAADDLDHMSETLRSQIINEERYVWNTGLEVEGTNSSLRRDGTPFHVIYAKLPYRSPDGSMLGVLTVLTDVSRIKEAEERARQAETRLTHITDSMPGIVYQYLWQGPGQGRFLYTSQGVKEILGVDKQELTTSESAGDIFGFTEDALQDVVSKVAHHDETLAPLDLEVKVERPEGDRYLQVRGSFVHHGQQELILNGVIQDITVLKQQEYELRQAQALAEQAMQARSRFLATMSHELRTPISGMHGMLELLQGSELNDDQRYILRNVVTSTNSLLYLVNDILDFSKMEAGQLQLHYQNSRLQSVICDVIRGHATLAYSKGLNVVLEWARGVPDQADIDVVRVGQVISNLLNNAVKFTVQGCITIRVSYHHEQLAIRVSDTGIGIAQEKQALLFTPFQQVESDINRRFGGTGLGLAICAQLAHKMGGTLTLKSKAGEGSRFRFTVPLQHPQWDSPALADSEWWYFSDNPALSAAMQRLGAKMKPLDASQLNDGLQGLLLADEQWLEHALGEKWQGWLQQSALKGLVVSHHEALRGKVGSSNWWRLGLSPLYPDLLLESCLELTCKRSVQAHTTVVEKLGGKVLVADDHPINRALLARQLAILGVEAQVVEDGEKALRAWQGQDFSLLLTDCHMPVMDGYTLTQALRAQGETAPIIGVTADTSEEAGARMVAAGMSGMLFKPYPLETLRQLLAHWLSGNVTTSNESEVNNEEGIAEQAERWLSIFGDEQTARLMAAEYLDSNRQDGEEMAQSLASRDALALVETAHRIKGAARMVGLDELATHAAKLESAARLKQMDKLDELAFAVQQLINAITHEIGLWLDEKSTT
ncbi:ATP-binding protein [Aeromonas cavernicola]|uniref:histidine kinase n=1 Tax=Aeromonas cavernicola TaxID=1006623 RepID=A0A2H9U5Q6_9GAMM|nr:transporter substrate-binding domain-containing protein [Aeromonas cavernicola]PJG59319.1 histidine kinase [Aeromonas cavernicola]